MGQTQALNYIHATPHSIDHNGTGNPIFRNIEAPDDLYQAQDFTINSIFELFKRSVDKEPLNQCLGTKCQIPQKDDRPDQYEYQWKSYGEVYRSIQLMANCIMDHQLYSSVHDPEFNMTLKVIGISAVNREEWIVTDLASNSLGITTVPLYETLGQDMLKIVLEQTQMSTIFGDNKCLTNILTLGGGATQSLEERMDKPQELFYLQQVVCFGESSHQLVELCTRYGIELHYYNQLITMKAMSANLVDYSQFKANRKAIFTISYTSGTTNNSKGVMLSNENFLSAITNILKVAGEFTFTKEDVYISYLPLAHVFDRLGVYSCLSVGTGVGFFGGIILKIVDDLQLLKPTIFPTVPRLLNKVYDKITQGLQTQAGYVKRYMFYKGVAAKEYYLEQSGAVTHEMYDRLIFQQAKERLGGRVRIMITGSAPIAPKVLSFLKCVFCCPIVEAYGQTESCGASFSTKLFDNRSGHVGGPAIGIEYTLRDLPDLEYISQSKPHPKGEILIRGPSIFCGYFKNMTLTKDTLTEDGWLQTGDVGMLLPLGNGLQIIDRIKNIFKLSQGEYIVSEKLERIYEQSPYIAQIFIHGDSHQDHIVAVLYPEEAMLKQYVQNLVGARRISIGDLEQWIERDDVKALIQSEFDRLAQENHLNSLEKIRNGNFRIVTKEFEIGTILTPTQKLKRNVAKAYFRDLIDDMYSKSTDTSNRA